MKKKLLFVPILLLTSCQSISSTSVQSVESSTTPNIESKTESNIESISKDLYTNLSIIEFNDVHGFISQDEYNMQGLSNASYLINNIRARETYDNVLLLGNGDMFQGTALVKESYGRVMIDAMNQMKFDCLGIGNHEFDWGLDKILNYFDGNESNGEANFPLLNANIYDGNNLLTIDNGKIYDSYIFDKSNIKVGVIEYIGDVKNSIDQQQLGNYIFDTNYKSSVENIGQKLKDYGANIIVVSIHGGSTTGVNYYNPNKVFANAKDKNGNYLVDAIINGHTHTYQDGYIERPNGLDVPVVQSKSYQSNHLYSFGQIDLKIDNSTKKVISSTIKHNEVSSAKDNYDKKVQNIIDTYTKEFENNDTILTLLTSSLPKATDIRVQEWMGRVALKETGADVFIMNYGSTRVVLPQGRIKKSDFYSYIPFDNNIFVHNQQASKVKEFMDFESNYDFCYVRPGVSLTGNDIIKVATISYVYNGTYYDSIRTEAIDDHALIRDILIEDLKERETFDIYKDYNTVAL